MVKKKLLIIILPLSIIIVAGGILGIYFYLLNFTTMIGWVEFKDDFYGYSVKYPKDWFVYPDEIHKPGYSTDITSFDVEQYNEEQIINSPSINGELIIHITVNDFGDSLSLDEWLKRNPPPFGEVVLQKEVTFDGIKGVEQSINELGKIVYITKGDKLFIIHAEPLESLEKEYSRTYDLVLSAFEFSK